MKLALFNYLKLEYGGGLAEYYVTLAEGISQRYPNVSISLVTLDDKLSQRLQKLYGVYFGTLRPLSHKQASKRSLPECVSYYTAHTFTDLREYLGSMDIVYSKNDMVEAFLLKMLVGYKHLPPLIYGFHTPVHYEKTYSLHDKLHNILYSSYLYRFLLSGCSALHVLNSYDENLLHKRFPALSVIKIPNPFDYHAFTTLPKHPTFHLPKNAFNILWVGRLTKEKGSEELSEIIRATLSRANHISIQWHIIGEGPYMKLLKKLQREYPSLHLYGSIQHDKIKQFYAQSDLFVSTSHFECFPYTLLEAQSFGIPIVAFDIHGVNDIIKHKENGLLGNDTATLLKHIHRIINTNPFTKNDIRIAIRKKFPNETSYQAFYKLISTL